jgi:hypothetical protein
MAKYTLIAEHTDIYGKPTGHKVTHEFTVDDLSTVLENTDLFLRGVGFMPPGILDYVPDDTYYGTPPEWHTEEFETPTDDVNHSEYYFDTERNK